MKLIKKYPVAIILSVLVIALAIVLGQAKHMENGSSTPQTGSHSNSLDLDQSLDSSPFDKFILDDAEILSSVSRREISLYNANCDNKFQSIVAVVTLDSTNGSSLEDVARIYAQEGELSKHDALLLLSVDDQASYLSVGDLFFPNETRADFQNLLDRSLTTPFLAGNYEEAISSFFSTLNVEYSSLPSQNSVMTFVASRETSMIVTAVVFVILAFVFFTVIDNIRYSRYHRQYVSMLAPPVLFHPILFWHRPGSRWFLRRQRAYHRPPPPPPRSGPCGGGFGGGSFRGGGFGGGSSRGGGFGGRR